ncbi:2261_t:CDS:2 [Ambispora gerdemannii]|uniref:2261_t:CDS:1 n=1 Tax=Ambispora gerdemannii TaxID=144530 RepID=A0A9N9CGL4_9GLOM|nr:2261_t:CDS:2 [Ambispora gerdemannii]
MSRQDSITARVVLITVLETEAKELSKKILEKKYAAAINIIPAITSFYWWKNEIVESLEQMLVIKTEDYHVKELVEYVKNNQTYQVPGIISIKIDEGNPDYLTWIERAVFEPHGLFGTFIEL